MKLLVLGINHQTAPVSLRERVSFPDAALPRALGELRGLDRVHEAAVLSTCNRTEVYAVAEDEDGGEAVARWLAAQAGEEGASLPDYLYRHADADAARHLFRVATGLDSLVLGEPQILGQVKQAWAGARGAGSLGAQLDRLFQHAFTTAKRARTDTLIGANPVSVASTAVRLAQESFAPLEDSTVLLVGAGETIELAARHLAQARVRRLMVANRTLAHAQDLASRHGGVALPLQDVRQHLGEADVVISATAAREPILDVDDFTHALAQRRHRPVLALDLAVPRDIAPGVGALRDVYLYTVDDLERSVEDNRRSRRDAAQAAEAIIDLQVGRFMEGQAVRAGSAPIRQLRAQAEAAREDVLGRARARLAAGQEPDEVLAYLAHTLTNRVLHTPTLALREAAANGDRELLRVAGRLFGAPPDSTKP